MSYDKASRLMIPWFDSFGVDAHRMLAPQGAKLPYVIYDISSSSFAELFPSGLKVYDTKVNENGNAIGYSRIMGIIDTIEQSLPIVLTGEDGNVVINKGEPFVQEITEEDILGFYINLEIMTNY